MPDSITLQPIGIIHSCYKEKFGIPRQPNLVPAATAELELLSPYNRPEAVMGLEQSSHIWIQFLFHQCMRDEWRATVRPPRLGGNQRMGVFATRSTFRPNPMGLSVVKLEGISTDSGVTLQLSGIDLLDGTPVLDIKPYVPYVDSVPEATFPIAPEAPVWMPVTFSAEAAKQCQHYTSERDIDLHTLITQILQQDPRPAYQAFDPERRYGMHLLDLNLQWRYCRDSDGQEQDNQEYIEVTAITPMNP